LPTATAARLRASLHQVLSDRLPVFDRLGAIRNVDRLPGTMNLVLKLRIFSRPTQWKHRNWRKLTIRVIMKVAFTTKTGEMIDLHFGQTDPFRSGKLAGAAESAGNVTIAAMAPMRRTGSRRGQMCSPLPIVYTMQIGGPAAAKLVGHKIHP